ncbi:MAG: prepilin peptidase [Brevundimonas sp.]|uniref:A24 family peptidase n=1 Tax=Brevundimonas sp. TaxID=1871086 RepID=UPI0039198365
MDVLTIVFLAMLPVVAVMAGVRDLATMTIPNWMSLILIAAFIPAALLAGLGWQALLVHLGIGVAALIIGIGLFALRVIGGGDAKLMAALSLWMGPEAVLMFVLWTAMIGGLFSLGLILARRHFADFTPLGLAWVGRLLEPKGDIPYGVAIAAGALLAWPSSAMMAAAF